MSHTGKILRGSKWLSMRVAVVPNGASKEYAEYEGVFLPKGILHDPAKMADVEYALANSETKKKRKRSDE
jgi:hypothetical protein